MEPPVELLARLVDARIRALAAILVPASGGSGCADFNATPRYRPQVGPQLQFAASSARDAPGERQPGWHGRPGRSTPPRPTFSTRSFFLSAQLLPDSAQALLALADGTVFRGISVGAAGETTGEVVFNTALTGYQEILTDPSYCRQLVTLTYPHIGSYGSNGEDIESVKVYAAGLIVKDVPRRASSFRSSASLPDYLRRENTVAIAGIDTRRLTRHLRSGGAQNGCIVALAQGAAVDAGTVDRAIAACPVGTEHVGPRPGARRQRERGLRVAADRVGARPRLRSSWRLRASTSSPSTSASSTTSCACSRRAAAASPSFRRRPPQPACSR